MRQEQIETSTRSYKPLRTEIRGAAYRWSVVIPIGFIWVGLIYPFDVYIEQIHLTLWSNISSLLFLAITVLWLSICPMRRYCCNGSIYELFYNCTPVFVYLCSRNITLLPP